MGYFHAYELLFYAAVNLWAVYECLRFSHDIHCAQKHPDLIAMSMKNASLLKRFLLYVAAGKLITLLTLLAIICSREIASAPGYLEALRDNRAWWVSLAVLAWVSVDAEIARFTYDMRTGFTPKIGERA